MHSFALSILIRNPGCARFPSPLRIPDDYEYKQLIRPHLARLISVELKKLDKLVAEMSAMWTSLNPLELPEVSVEERARFTGAWQIHREVFGYTLQAELPDLMRKALLHHDDLLGSKWDFLIVDEYQDLNACDIEVLRLFAKLNTWILALGDDDQSVYSFRNAHPAGIRRFLDEYQTDHDFKLTICKRSPRPLVDWAQHVIQGDIDREPRTPPECDNTAIGTMTALLKFKGERKEARGVARIINWLINKECVSAGDILVLSRTDSGGKFTSMVKEELDKLKIPMCDAGIIETEMKAWQNRYMIACLRLFLHQNDPLAWWTLLDNTNGIGEAFVDHIFRMAQSARKTFGEVFLREIDTEFVGAPASSSTLAYKVWRDITSKLERITLPASDESETPKWGEWIIELINSQVLPACSSQFREILLKIDQRFESEGNLNPAKSLERYISQIQPLGEDIMREESAGVRFMTMVGSKGLTAEATIVLGVEDDLIPSSDKDLAEERRILYVAMTRARKYLFLTWSNMRSGPTAYSGQANKGRRHPTRFIEGSTVESQDGEEFVLNLPS
jgi:DNA helicase-2/ATP-dependent DNA helicase PcrA